jgi:hypothetical protein
MPRAHQIAVGPRLAGFLKRSDGHVRSYRSSESALQLVEAVALFLDEIGSSSVVLSIMGASLLGPPACVRMAEAMVISYLPTLFLFPLHPAAVAPDSDSAS